MKFRGLKTLLVLVAIVSARLADAFSFTGNRLFSDDDLARLVDSSMRDDSVASLVRSSYREEGYYNAEVNVFPGNGPGEKEVRIIEGQAAMIDSVRLDLTSMLEAVAFDDPEKEVRGRIASRATLDGFAGECIGRLAEQGMPYASAAWRDFQFQQDGNLVATLGIITGPVTRVSGIKFNGVKRSRPETLLRSIRLKSGQTFIESAARESERSINQLPYVDIVTPFELRPSANAESSVVIFNVKELPSTRFDGAGGLVTVKGSSVILGRLDLEFGDILGTGRSFGFFWNKKDRFSSEIRLEYFEPFFLNGPFDMHLEVYQVDKDTSFIETGGAVGFKHGFAAGLSGSVWFSLTRTEAETHSAVAPSNGKSIRLDMDLDRTENRDNPKSGYEMATSVCYKYRSNRQSVTGTSDLPTRLTSAGFDMRYFAGFIRGFVVALRLTGWGIIANDGRAPVDELHYLGGSDNLRGYAAGRFPAYRYGMATLEPRLLSGRFSRVYLYADLAEINGSQDYVSRYVFYPGYGLGVVAPSPLGQFKIEAGWGKEGFPSQPVFNLGIVGAF